MASSLTTKSYLLRNLLRQVSRSFYFTLAILPASVRTQVGLAYLFARAADTITDTDLIAQSKRLTYLKDFQKLFTLDTIDWKIVQSIQAALISYQVLPGERILLERLEDCFRLYLECDAADQVRIRRLMTTLTKGMEMDLEVFQSGTAEHPQPLQTPEELDRYIYYVAGCVGEYWTNLMCAHQPTFTHWNVKQMSNVSIHFGKGLQLTNIVKDVAKDLRRGRCYIPASLLKTAGLTTDSLRQPESWAAFQPILNQLIRQAMEHLDQGWNYTMAIPPSEIRLRLACMWPILFGGETLKLVKNSPNVLNPDCQVKITRGCVYRIIGLTTITGGSSFVATAYWKRLHKQ
ncbi:MAG: squalene/phytoene synthase family protein [Betaproteobacteria bacterium]|nr:MAG: squalene/phytoene synthase family protein [Betaproteobacteria bacterium]